VFVLALETGSRTQSGQQETEQLLDWFGLGPPSIGQQYCVRACVRIVRVCVCGGVGGWECVRKNVVEVTYVLNATVCDSP